MRPVILLSDNEYPDDAGLEREIIETAGYDLRVGHCRTESDLIAAAKGTVGVLLHRPHAGRTFFKQVPSIRAVVCYGTGTDSVDEKAAAEAGVQLGNVVGYCTDEVADHAMSLLLCATRGIAASWEQVRSGTWPSGPDVTGLVSLRDRRLGLLGFGRIGQAVARRARAFGMQVVAHDPEVPGEAFRAAGVESVRLAEVFGCDVVSLHVPLTAKTRGIVSRSLLKRMPPGAVLVNVSRGGLVDENALLAGLQHDQPAFAVLDVLDQEPPDPDHPLVRHPRVVVTPHIGYYSPGSVHRLRRGACLRLIELLD